MKDYNILNPYPNYKLSGVEWVREIPSSWHISRLKNIKQNKKFSIVDGPFGTQLGTSDYQDKGLPLIRVADLDFNGQLILKDPVYITEEKWKELIRSAVYPNDIIIAKTGATIGKSGIVPSHITKALIASSCIKVSPDPKKIYPKFLNKVITSKFVQEQIINLAGGSTRDTINLSPFSTIQFCLPPLTEQLAIADFLDHQTAKIDALIEKQERLIKLLEEKRNALISHAVTKGLDPNVPMKDSGVEWLGEIPEHWNKRKLKFVSTMNDETLGETTNPDYEIIYVDIGNIDKDKGVLGSENFRFEDAPSRARRVVRDGDIIVSTVRTYLRAITSINNPPNNLIVSTGFAVIRPRNKINSTFASFVLRSSYFIEKVVANSTGVSYPATNIDSIGNIEIPLPPINEQNVISNYLEEQLEKFEKLNSKAYSAIKYLNEYRSSLISSAVTGKIDVRDWQEKDLVDLE